ncbi:MAG: hypothetical protein K6F21_01935 [Bacteroidales bacterium]|nr:hypothetical protein [Bacteroidales bacterium]
MPSSVGIKTQTSHSAILQWDEVKDADTYDWKLEENSQVFKQGSTNSTYVIIDGLSEGHLFQFYVRAVNSAGASAYSEPLILDFGGSADPDTPSVPGALCTDAPLLLSLDSTPVLGSKGSIKVFDSSDNQVDEIKLEDISGVSIREDGQMIPKDTVDKATIFNTTLDAIKCGSRWRIVHYTPLRIREKALEIKLHSGVLDFGKEYYVTVDAGVVQGHEGIAKGAWTFTTKAKPGSTSVLAVNQDGSADFCTVQGAISYSTSLGKDNSVQINIASGTYNEMLYIRDKNKLTLKGDSRQDVLISYANNESYESGTGAGTSSKPSLGSAIGTSGGRGMILADGCDNLVLENLTMHNTFGNEKGQAEVIYFNSNYKLTIENCSLISLQDTFECKGYVYVHNSLVAGGCDFIWGSPKACLFEDCEIRSDARGFIVQARVPEAADKGFVFLNCKLTAASGVKDGTMYLARSGGSSTYFDNVTYVNCTMAPVIASAGWYTSPSPNPASPTAVSGWKEYGSKGSDGKELNMSLRSRSGKVLTADEAAAFSSRKAVLGY